MKRRILLTIGLLMLAVSTLAATVYNWSAPEYVLSYGNNGFVTYKVYYNLIETDGVPWRKIDVKLLNKGKITGPITGVDWSTDDAGKAMAVVYGDGTHIYDTYATVGGRLVKTTHRIPVKIEFTFLYNRVRAAQVAIQITVAADGSTVYDSLGYWPFLMWTYMKAPE